jgi:hypothetical protein
VFSHPSVPRFSGVPFYCVVFFRMLAFCSILLGFLFLLPGSGLPTSPTDVCCKALLTGVFWSSSFYYRIFYFLIFPLFFFYFAQIYTTPSNTDRGRVTATSSPPKSPKNTQRVRYSSRRCTQESQLQTRARSPGGGTRHMLMT